MRAVGFIELPNFADAVEALDLMLKTADVRLLTRETSLGGRLVTLVIEGSVSAVGAAVDAAKAGAAGNIVASAVIANPHLELQKLIAVSAKKYGDVSFAPNLMDV